MSRPSRILLCAALCALASVARAEPLQLVAPAAGTTLRGGSFAEVRWSARDLPARYEEWEAFLSVDGGKYYAFRVTPHLNVELKRFTFAVPNVETREARILLRAGDEKHEEEEFEAPFTFAIAADPDAVQSVRTALHFGRGEAARSGDPVVLAWTDGARNGSCLAQQSSLSSPSPSLVHDPGTTHESGELLPAPAQCVAAVAATRARHAPANGHARTAARSARSVDLLLVCRRRNI